MTPPPPIGLLLLNSTVAWLLLHQLACFFSTQLSRDSSSTIWLASSQLNCHVTPHPPFGLLLLNSTVTWLLLHHLACIFSTQLSRGSSSTNQQNSTQLAYHLTPGSSTSSRILGSSFTWFICYMTPSRPPIRTGFYSTLLSRDSSSTNQLPSTPLVSHVTPPSPISWLLLTHLSRDSYSTNQLTSTPLASHVTPDPPTISWLSRYPSFPLLLHLSAGF